MRPVAGDSLIIILIALILLVTSKYVTTTKTSSRARSTIGKDNLGWESNPVHPTFDNRF